MLRMRMKMRTRTGISLTVKNDRDTTSWVHPHFSSVHPSMHNKRRSAPFRQNPEPYVGPTKGPAEEKKKKWKKRLKPTPFPSTFNGIQNHQGETQKRRGDQCRSTKKCHVQHKSAPLNTPTLSMRLGKLRMSDHGRRRRADLEMTGLDVLLELIQS